MNDGEIVFQIFGVVIGVVGLLIAAVQEPPDKSKRPRKKSVAIPQAPNPSPVYTPMIVSDGLTREERWKRDHPEEVDIFKGLKYSIDIDYTDRFRNKSIRRIRVENVVGSPDNNGILRPTTLYAFCERAQEMRSFLIANISRAVECDTREILMDVVGRLTLVASAPMNHTIDKNGNWLAERREWLLALDREGLSGDDLYWKIIAQYPQQHPAEFLEVSHGAVPKGRRPLTKTQGVDPKKLEVALQGIQYPLKIGYDGSAGDSSIQPFTVRRMLGRLMPDGKIKVTTLVGYGPNRENRSLSVLRIFAAWDGRSEATIADVPWHVWRMTADKAESVPGKAPGDPSR